jgi:hypothetical protein
MKIWHSTYWIKLLKKTYLITFLVLSISLQAQNVPFEVRNFLLDFEKVIDLGEFDSELLSNRFSTTAAEKFINFFIDKDLLIYNDLVQESGYPLYLNPGEYVKRVSELYPVGLVVYISNTEILNVKEYSTYSLYVVEVEKTILIDNMIDNPPIPKFHSPVRLIFYIVKYTNAPTIKIIGIEAAGTAVNNKSIYNNYQPDRVEFNAHFSTLNINFNAIPEQYKEVKTSGNQNRYGLLLGWDLSGKKSLTYGIAAGVFYDKTNFSTDLASYTDNYIPSIDKDSFHYNKIISGKGVNQDNSRGQLSVPLYFNLNWELPARWGNKYAKRSFSGDLSYKRGINFNFRIGPHIQYHLMGSNDPYQGTFSYSGLYRFYNPITQDSNSVIISDLPEYGFSSDTSFTTSASNLNYNKINIGLSTQLNISIPIYKSIEFYLGPSLFYNFSSLAQSNDDYVLSGQIGENNSLLSSTKTKSVSYGINAGIILNLHAHRNPYSPVDLPARVQSQFKTKTAYTVEKSSLNKMELIVNLFNSQSSTDQKKVKINYTINTDWLKKPIKGNFFGYKAHTLKYSFPQSANNLNFKSELIIKKPFGYDISCHDTIASNSVNQPQLIVSLDNLNKLIRNRQTLDLTVTKLPTFNFIYISLYNVSETVEQRQAIVNLVRKIGNEAIYNREEIMVYISTEINKPIAFSNFVTGDLPDNIVTNWDQFLYKLEEEWNSRDLTYQEDIANIDQVLGPLLNLDERANANRRYVNYHFMVNESDKYYGIDPDIISDTRSLIYFISNKYCEKIPFKSDQYSFNVYLTEKYKNERRSPSDINIDIQHIIK